MHLVGFYYKEIKQLAPVVGLFCLSVGSRRLKLNCTKPFPRFNSYVWSAGISKLRIVLMQSTTLSRGVKNTLCSSLRSVV